jgi:hypothetical protein
MKITKKFLSIPPYLSTSWERIVTLRLQQTDLLVYLFTGEVVSIPNLTPETLEIIFNAHVAFLEDTEAQTSKNDLIKNSAKKDVEIPGESTLKIGFGSVENMSAAMHHNSELANAPDIPREVLEKISTISRIIAPDDVLIPKAEPHCNCPYCQIARTIHQTNEIEELAERDKNEPEEEVKEEDLRFQEWDITQSGDKLFTVINKLDSQEKYSVYLGHPVGCTCGKEGCEHILAVLKS